MIITYSTAEILIKKITKKETAVILTLTGVAVSITCSDVFEKLVENFRRRLPYELVCLNRILRLDLLQSP